MVPITKKAREVNKNRPWNMSRSRSTPLLPPVYFKGMEISVGTRYKV